MLKKYREEFGMLNINKLYYLIPGKRLNDGLRVMEGDGGLNDMIKVIRDFTDKCNMHIYPVEDDYVGHLNTQSSVVKRNSVAGNCFVPNLSSWQVDHDCVVGDRDGEIGQQIHSDIERSGGGFDLDFGDDDNEKSIENASEGLSTDYYSDEMDFDLINQNKKKVEYRVDNNNPHFELGMSFGDAHDARFVIARYSIANGTPLKLRPNEPKRIRAKFKTEGCPFHLFISQDGKDGGLLVKKIDDQHTCLRDFKNPMASAKFLAKEFKDRIYENSKTSAKDLHNKAEKEMKLYVTKSKCKRIKRLVLNDLDGSYKAEFAYLVQGLVYAVSHLLPKVEHRYCARHVHANWSKKWRSSELKKRFWICAWSTYKEEFDDNLKHLGALSKQAAEDFVKYNLMTFCRAFFSSRSKCDIVDNNMCESFNSTIVDAREKPIVSILTEIRLAAMERLAAHKILSDKWINEWSPTCMQKYQDNMEAAFGCIVFFNGAYGYEIVDGDDRHNVVMQPMPGKEFMDCDAFDKLQPPPIEAMTGRPRKQRIRGSSETKRGKLNGKLSKKGATMHCTICHSKEHNRATCLTKQSQTRKPVGLGLYVDEISGNMTLNPGCSFESIIIQKDPIASLPISRISDPITKYPIPNEREVRRDHQASILSKSSGTRRIAFAGDGSQSITP
ncbi:hypothetical protein C2S52_014125 [Perilla frutescens var. hirtella]|nr:hypothetical protein C2S52_014125 [Perilla frutescens var. hirtella]